MDEPSGARRLEALRWRIERSVLAASAPGREMLSEGTFVALIEPSTPLMYLSYAVPVKPLGEPDAVRADLERLERLFRARGRRLRFEFTEELWPGLSEALASFGLEREGGFPMMMPGPGGVAPAFGRGVQVRYLASGERDSVLAEYLAVRNAAYELAERPSPEEVARLAGSLAAGSVRAAIATIQGRMVGIASLIAADGIGELVGVGTLPAARRRGVASCLSSRLTADYLASGGELVWLSAGDPVAQAVYQGIGFEAFATHTAWHRPEPSAAERG